MSTPLTPFIDNPFLTPSSIAFLMSFPLTMLHTKVAAASANPAFLAKIVTASASPKLKAWLNLPELVAIPAGNFLSLKPNFLEREI